MTGKEYVKVVRIIAQTLEDENRCDELGIEVSALKECSDYFERLVEFSTDSLSLAQKMNKEFPSNSYMVGRESRKIIKTHDELGLKLTAD